MSDPRWQDTDQYLREHLMEDDEVLEGALRASTEAGLPAIAVSPLQGKFLHVLARLMGARRVLEIGTLGGYSAIWLARALPPGGQVVSLELNPEHASVARANISRAGLDGTVEVIVGPALDSLARLAASKAEAGEGSGALFDLTFIDADKPNNANYWRWALKLTRSGGVVVVDNVVRNGALPEAGSTDASVVGSREVIEAIGATDGAVGSALQTVGVKGYDGFAIAIVGGGGAAA